MIKPDNMFGATDLSKFLAMSVNTSDKFLFYVGGSSLLIMMFR